MSLILTTDNSSKEILEENEFSNFKYSGDTRFDNFNDVEPKLILDFRSPCVILGSSWEKEEKMAAEIIEEMDNVNWIITPHEIKEIKY